MKESADWTIIFGSSANMAAIADQSIDLIFTSPPYFSEEQGARLRKGELRNDGNLRTLKQSITEYAWSFRQNFSECFRVLKPGRFMIVQTRDIRLHQLLVAIEGIHRHLIESVGFDLYTRYQWLQNFAKREKQTVREQLSDCYGPTALEPEVFLVFRKDGPVVSFAPTKQSREILEQPLAQTSVHQSQSRHEHQSPIEMLLACIQAFSNEQDTVLDCFCGGGSTLAAAHVLNRKSFGFEVNRQTVDKAKTNIEAMITRWGREF